MAIPKQITESALRDEWARLLGPRWPTIDDRGYTARELALIYGYSVGYTREKLRDLVGAGKAKQIGIRSSRSRPAVYDVTAPAEDDVHE